jgi:hypothetical protein
MCAVWNDFFDLKVINSKLILKPNSTKSVISVPILIYIFLFNTTHIFQYTLLIFSQQRVTCSFLHTLQHFGLTMTTFHNLKVYALALRMHYS